MLKAILSDKIKQRSATVQSIKCCNLVVLILKCQFTHDNLYILKSHDPRFGENSRFYILNITIPIDAEFDVNEIINDNDLRKCYEIKFSNRVKKLLNFFPCYVRTEDVRIIS